MQPHKSTDHPLQTWPAAIWLLIVLLTPLFVNFWVEQQFEASKIWLLRTLIWLLTLLWLAGWVGNHQPKLLPSSLRNLLIALVLVLALSTFLSTYHFHSTSSLSIECTPCIPKSKIGSISEIEPILYKVNRFDNPRHRS